MIKLTERERMLRTFRHEEVDRIMMVDNAWAGTVRRWYNEGLPHNMAWEDYFGFDRSIMINPDNSPRYPSRVLEVTDRYRIETTPWGGTQKSFNELDSTPEVTEHYYGTPDKWE